MKLLLSTDDRDVANRVDTLLRTHGVATFVRTSSPRFPYHAKLFVLIDLQYDDAVALVRNPQHIVQHRLPPGAIDEIFADFSYGPLIKPSLILLGIVLVMLAIALELFTPARGL